MKRLFTSDEWVAIVFSKMPESRILLNNYTKIISGKESRRYEKIVNLS